MRCACELPQAYAEVISLMDDSLMQDICFVMQGLLPNYIKVVPSIAIAFVTYEKLKEGLGVELRISS